ncbi:hypothetical protein [uncultured Phocaeicola sp.]|uniref:hypothetical protein n=1 Tax=uncultured Phocaeicola sp. TaxID=990718 RepID=UPI00321FB307
MRKITRTLIEYSMRYIPAKVVNGTAEHDPETVFEFVAEKKLSYAELCAELAQNIETSFVIIEVTCKPTLFSMPLADFCKAAEKKEVK